jgi:hypothetical protein
VLAAGLSTSVLLHAFAKTIAFGEYLLNKEFIAEALCINKNKPQLNCEGQCHLGKQLEKAAEAEKAPVAPAGAKQDIVLFSEPLKEFHFANRIAGFGELPGYRFLLPEPGLNGVFQPPEPSLS